ncbi:hypothetical protein [Xanthomonas graminis]|uniref:hypothetical protein n=5 Tax=Xanthomonas graminis TaxID=3390026 RepID=UPI0011319118|nr:hypothetical protein [Xanthomonas translucens]UKE53747.1 hypothetical protein KFS84_16035 [Xanthomonas translucens pv. graminis]WIH08064.1 hypothetical protein KM579_16595 [Xanthomonas translucens pv. graminis]WIH13181.1 hypothetical protein KM563_05425 [Xanthomonas translucens pv. graminis]WIH16780.1 hypothetical protein KM433_05040 [Xanthomonas translucens pv. graminis]
MHGEEVRNHDGFRGGFRFSSSAHAAAVICNDCNLGKKQTISRELGIGSHYLWDFKDRTMYHMVVSGDGHTIPMSAPAADYLRVSSDPRLTISAGQLIVKEVMLTPDEKNGLNASLALYDENGGSATVIGNLQVPESFSIPASVATTMAVAKVIAQADGTRPMTAMDAVMTPAYRDAAVKAALSEKNLGPFWYFNERLRVAIANFTSAISLGYIQTPIKIIDNIQLRDGSFFRVEWNPSSTDYYYVKGSAIDAAGNPIPETIKDVTGEEGGKRNYVYPNTPGAQGAGTEMINHISDLERVMNFSAMQLS